MRPLSQLPDTQGRQTESPVPEGVVLGRRLLVPCCGRRAPRPALRCSPVSRWRRLPGAPWPSLPARAGVRGASGLPWPPGPSLPTGSLGEDKWRRARRPRNPRGRAGRPGTTRAVPSGPPKRYGSTAGSASSLNQAQRGHASLGYDDVKVGHLRFGVPKVDHRARAGAVTLVSADSL